MCGSRSELHAITAVCEGCRRRGGEAVFGVTVLCHGGAGGLGPVYTGWYR